MFTEDLSAFFNTAEHSIIGQLNGVDVTGNFDCGYVATGGGMGMADSLPMLTLPTASVPTNPVGKAFVYDNVTYAVTEHKPDGTGVSTLFLERT